ncbi:MAG: hypothetical protein DRP64_06205 [Verrucomicrobia bacterium]|nr:MAG: hypothetical protein DRP64_06205 [Verrucomicrobiota bacterium]
MAAGIVHQRFLPLFGHQHDGRQAVLKSGIDRHAKIHPGVFGKLFLDPVHDRIDLAQLQVMPAG